MSRFAAIVTTVAISLWLGGLIFLFIAVQTLFGEFPKQTSDVALQSAPRLFATFERYQMIVAGVALIAAFAWYLSGCSKSVILIFVLLLLATVAATISTTIVTARMELLRRLGASGSPEFMRLHGNSMMIYVAEAGFLLIAAMMLPLASAAPRDTSQETPPA